MTRLRIAAAVVLLVLVLASAAYVLEARREPGAPISTVLPFRPESRAPTGTRVRVQVLNTTRTRGLARRATRLLRDRGFDVVETGTTSPLADTTLVLDRSGHPEWAAAVGGVITPSRVLVRRDSSRYLDVTVLLGRSWRPPAQPLDP